MELVSFKLVHRTIALCFFRISDLASQCNEDNFFFFCVDVIESLAGVGMDLFIFQSWIHEQKKKRKHKCSFHPPLLQP